MIYNLLMWFIYSLAAACIYGCNEILGKYITDKKSQPILIGFFVNFYCLLIALSFSFFQPVKYSVNLEIIFGLLAAGLIYSLGTYTYYSALKLSPVSEFTLLTRSSVILIPLGGMIFLKESFSILQSLGILFIILGVITVTWTGKSITLHKGGLLALLTAFLFAVGALIDKVLINNFSALLYQVLSYILMVIFLTPALFVVTKKSKTLPSFKTHIMLFTSSGLFVLAGFLLLRAYQSNGLVSYVNLITQLRIPIVVIYGLLILKEKERFLNKLIAMFLIIIGTFLLK